jgi:hypothetical protein
MFRSWGSVCAVSCASVVGLAFIFLDHRGAASLLEAEEMKVALGGQASCNGNTQGNTNPCKKNGMYAYFNRLYCNQWSLLRLDRYAECN